REHAGEAERHRSHERAEPDRLRLAGERRERRPRVGRAGARTTVAHVEVVVGPEERVEPELFGEAGEGEQLLVGRTLLGLGEDTEFHGGRRYSYVYATRIVPTARGYAAEMLSVDRWPELNEPLLVAALSGWVDAGGAGAG